VWERLILRRRSLAILGGEICGWVYVSELLRRVCGDRVEVEVPVPGRVERVLREEEEGR